MRGPQIEIAPLRHDGSLTRASGARAAGELAEQLLVAEIVLAALCAEDRRRSRVAEPSARECGAEQ